MMEVSRPPALTLTNLVALPSQLLPQLRLHQSDLRRHQLLLRPLTCRAHCIKLMHLLMFLLLLHLFCQFRCPHSRQPPNQAWLLLHFPLHSLHHYQPHSQLHSLHLNQRQSLPYSQQNPWSLQLPFLRRNPRPCPLLLPLLLPPAFHLPYLHLRPRLVHLWFLPLPQRPFQVLCQPRPQLKFPPFSQLRFPHSCRLRSLRSYPFQALLWFLHPLQQPLLRMSLLLYRQGYLSHYPLHNQHLFRL